MPNPVVSAQFDSRSGAGGQLALTRRLDAPVERVWRALVTPDEIAAWMGAVWLGGVEPLTAGSTVAYRFEDTAVDSRGQVRVCDAPRRLDYGWFDGAPTAGVLSWVLEPADGDCVLTLTHRFGAPDDAPRTAAGWTMILERLAAWLAGAAFPAGSWRALRDAYALQFGEAASRDGRAVLDGGAPSLRFVRIMPYAPAALWDVLVSREGLALWMGVEDSTVDGHLGGRFNLVLAGGSPMNGTITRWAPGEALEYAWTDADGSPALLRVELEPHARGARVIMTRRPDGGASRPIRAFGWHYHIDALDAAMEGLSIPFDPAHAAAMQAMYAATLG